jgi:1-pyrroline-5-carboxylate dehydrogenase
VLRGYLRNGGAGEGLRAPLNLQRWVSPRTINETFVPATDFRYPFLSAE